MIGLNNNFCMRFIKKIIKSIILPFFVFRHSMFYWRVRNTHARKLYEQSKESLSEKQKQIVDHYIKHGFARAHLDDFYPGQDMLSKMVGYIDSLSDTAHTSAKKSFFVDYWAHTGKMKLSPDNPFVMFMLDKNVLKIINGYTGMFMQLHALRAMRTRVAQEGERPTQSQLWHRDPEDKRTPKIMIYLNDVDEGTGPFSYVSGSNLGGKYWHLFPQYARYHPKRGGRISDEQVKDTIDPEDIHTCVGKAGTVLFVDPSGIHRGGYSTEKSRLTFLGTYKSAASDARPHLFEADPRMSQAVSDDNTSARYILSKL